MTEEILEALRIRYVKLHFKLAFLEDSVLPLEKASALRGGMGEMLLRANCIRNRRCETCDFEKECIVQRTMYSKFEKKPDYVTSGESVGYVLECEDHRENFRAGDYLDFSLLLFGKTIVYFNQYVQAFFALGTYGGLGKNHANFQIAKISNTAGESILKGNDINMSAYKVNTVADYVTARMKQLGNIDAETFLVFDTPLTLKYQGEFLQEFQTEAIWRAIRRRVYMLDCFEGKDVEWFADDVCELPVMLHQETKAVGVKRYSNRQNAKMTLRGIKGYAALELVSEEFLMWLLAGELIHIGKNTSFGFGRYHILMH